MKYVGLFVLFLWLCFLYSCKKDNTLFHRLDPSETGIDFSNKLIENDSFNILKYQYMYNGGGVGIGDFNGDGLQDIYFTGNLVSNKLYLNRGSFQFDDVTNLSGSACTDIWSSGASIVDINADGLDDIYVSATFYEDSTKRINQMLINKGTIEDGVPIFEDMANQMGLADNGYTTHTVFFDYDLDDDLDAFMLNNKLLLRRSTSFEDRITNGSSITTDRLYRNNGDGTFSDVSEEAGITIEGFGLGVSILDINEDGYPDIYVSNDFVTNDVLYVNEGNGTFTNRIQDYFSHQSFSSMGVDAGDLNNDGLDDLMTLDMLPEDDKRFKTMYGANQYQYFNLMEQSGYELQYYRNSFQLNNGNESFSEISQLLGVNATDWSWSVLFADFDNDTWSDIAITNGFPRDITDLDFINYRSGANLLLTINQAMLDQIPQVKLKNYFFRNTGGLSVKDVSEEWGIDLESFSNGAAYADLDNDGDLDYIVNNIDDPAHIYKNTLGRENNYIRLRLKGPPSNKTGIGSKVVVYAGAQKYVKTMQPYRGYISSVEPMLHFGLGKISKADSIIVTWPGQKKSLLLDPPLNTLIEISKENMLDTSEELDKNPQTYLKEISSEMKLDFVHEDVTFFDFIIQKLLPHMLSNEGPGVAVGDINNDGIEDMIIGNGRTFEMKAFLQSANGLRAYSIDDGTDSEDLGLLLFDADNDRDLDLYVCSGSSEYRAGDPSLQDRLLLNDGFGQFKHNPDRLPTIYDASSSAYSADFDKDGDMDVFVGSRLIPQSYPLPPSSHLLRNDNGFFTDISKQVLPELDSLGMVTAALWTDYNNDTWLDLLIIGEWMTIRLFENQAGKFIERTEELGLGRMRGWWNTITGADLDQNGYIDYIVGNQGLNNRLNPVREKPLRIVAKDFDKNGSVDNVMFGYAGDDLVPLHGLKDIKDQMNFMRRRYQKFSDYAGATYEDFFPNGSLEGAYMAECDMFESIILWNDGTTLTLEVLPLMAQLAPVYGIIASDLDLDGHTDLLLAGNRFGTERTSGKHDASIGVMLKGLGNREFEVVTPSRSGFSAPGDTKTMASFITYDDKHGIVVTRNNASPLVFEVDHPSVETKVISIPRSTQYLEIRYSDGTVERREIYHGQGYATTSSNKFILHPLIEKVLFVDMEGRSISGESEL